MVRANGENGGAAAPSAADGRARRRGRGRASRTVAGVGVVAVLAGGLGLTGAALSNALVAPVTAPAADWALDVSAATKADAQAARDAAAARATVRAARVASRAPVTKTDLSGSPKAIAQTLVAARGWGAAEFRCLDALWEKESNWTATADNPTSSAYGIPQALPGHRMKSHGADWRTNPSTQIRWGLDYIADRYTRPCQAWAHSRAHNWY